MRQVVLGNPLEREPLADLQLAGVRAQRLAPVVGAVTRQQRHLAVEKSADVSVF